MSYRNNYYYEYIPNNAGSVFCGKTRSEAADLYNCVHQSQCDIMNTHRCDCLKTPRKMHYPRDNNSARYRKHFAKETSNIHSRAKHDLLLMYIIYPKYVKSNINYLFVADQVSEVTAEVKRLNNSFRKEYWTFATYDEYNALLLSLEKHYKTELVRVNKR